MTDGGETLGVIFDMDGVLVDTGWAHRQAWFDVAAREGLPMSDEFFWGTFGMQNAAILPMLRPGISKDENPASVSVEGAAVPGYHQNASGAGARAFALLKDLKREGFRLAIGSSAPPENLDVFWDAHHLAGYFDARVTSEQVTESKPSPQNVSQGGREARTTPSRCAVIEDALQGSRRAKAAGMIVVA
jgi:beta-phosphoglucomutase